MAVGPASALDGKGSSANGITIRKFDRSLDNKACCDLEASASQTPPWAKWLIDGMFLHPKGFDARLNTFSLGHALVAINEETGALCGMVCAAAKKVHMRSDGDAEMLLGYIFDLRVDERVQGKGIGKRLSLWAEQLLEEVGCDRVYLTVNKDNKKAKALYNKLGYEECSSRWPHSGIISVSADEARDHAEEAAKAAGASVHRIEKAEEALEHYCKHLADYGDFALAKSEAELLFKSDQFLGMYVATPSSSSTASPKAEKEFASVVLWHGSKYSGFTLTRFFGLPSGAYFGKPGVALACAAACALLAGYGGLTYAAVSHGAWWSMLGCSLFCAGSAWIGSKAMPFVRVIGSLLKKPASADAKEETELAKTRARLWGAVGKGNKAGALLKAAVAAAEAEATESGFVMSVLNMDEDHPLRGHLPRGKFRTTFMQKAIGQKATSSLPRLHPLNFHDPRDI
eukprot:TRINITY_DN29757_c0_g1_i1.p1 TRINITY_DN29757_c0_g1~~TRINITY_DN29757_c0_g1_i1.p1  ORF type:complete len:456 (+),score=121.74 TRINITY_DN29757_c0_g1_i1:86-1453(+)